MLRRPLCAEGTLFLGTCSGLNLQYRSLCHYSLDCSVPIAIRLSCCTPTPFISSVGKQLGIMVELSSQTIGLIAGVVVFCATVLTTFLLLVFGGSFKRMREEVCCTYAAVIVSKYKGVQQPMRTQRGTRTVCSSFYSPQAHSTPFYS